MALKGQQKALGGAAPLLLLLVMSLPDGSGVMQGYWAGIFGRPNSSTAMPSCTDARKSKLQLQEPFNTAEQGGHAQLHRLSREEEKLLMRNGKKK